MSKAKSTKTERTCETCRHCFSKTDAAGFTYYYCTLHPGCIKGALNYLEGEYFSKACEKYEERAPARRG